MKAWCWFNFVAFCGKLYKTLLFNNMVTTSFLNTKIALPFAGINTKRNNSCGHINCEYSETRLSVNATVKYRRCRKTEYKYEIWKYTRGQRPSLDKICQLAWLQGQPQRNFLSIKEYIGRIIRTKHSILDRNVLVETLIRYNHSSS